ncbi:hypothetical protein QCE73_03970 [Caballeronia sp. LZ029]|uniref:hypothetical protein n=1 Tax=Caballeronia sp. LZ029 TaxID=3038564 RepID=UPI00285A206C|nr:hypothetical protein [Caballeronia sp. LZ029]MDR5742309.1 hypothetical protein [Caballeronia sp. LZ029]
MPPEAWVRSVVKKTAKLDGRKSAMSAGKRQRGSPRTQRAGPADRFTAARLSRDEWVQSQRLSPLLIFAGPFKLAPKDPLDGEARGRAHKSRKGRFSAKSGDPQAPLTCAQNVWPEKAVTRFD